MADVIPFDQVEDDIGGTVSASNVIPFDQVVDDVPAGPKMYPPTMSGYLGAAGDLISEVPGQLWTGIKNAPAAVGQMVSDIPTGVSNLAHLPGDLGNAGNDAIKLALNNIFDTDYFQYNNTDYGRAERTLKGIATFGTDTAGALVAGPVGAAVGDQSLEMLLQELGVNPQTNPDQDLKTAIEKTGTFATLNAGGKIISDGVGKLGPQTQLGANKVASDTLAKVSNSTPEQVVAAIEKLKNDPLAAQKTTAEVLRSPELATLEQSMGTVKPTEMAASQAARAEASNNLLSQVASKTDALPENTGAVIQEAFAKQKAFEKGKVKEAYEAVPEGTKLDATPIANDVLASMDKYWGEGSPKFPTELEALLDPVSKGGEMTVGTLQNVRSHLAAYARDAVNNPKTQRQAAIAKAAADSIADNIGKTPEAAGLWSVANELRAKFADKFGKGPLTKMDQTIPSATLNNILKSPESAQKAYDVIGKNKEAMQVVKDQIGTDLLNKSDSARVKFITENASELKTLLGKEDFAIVEAIKNDAQTRIGTQKMANPTAGSNTALKLSNIVERALTGKDNIGAKTGRWAQIANKAMQGGGLTLGAAATYAAPQIAIPAIVGGAVIKGLRGRSAGLVQNALFEQLKNPEAFAEALNTKPGTKGALNSLLTATLGTNPEKKEKNSQLQQSLNNVGIDMKKEDVALLDNGKFAEKVNTIADDLGADPEHIMQVMQFETGGTLDPAEKNRAGSGATGLIQFMPATAKALTGKESGAEAIKYLEKMTPTQQLDYVKKYLEPYKGKLNTLEDVYMAVLYPKAIGKGNEYPLFKKGTEAYRQNAGLDIDLDGIVTKAEAAQKVEAFKV